MEEVVGVENCSSSSGSVKQREKERSARGDELGVAALSDLKDFAV